jgi:large subunit ribosomal protein L1
MAKRGKRYEESAALVDKTKAYSPDEAVDLAKQTAKAKYDETVEIHMRMGLDPRHADQQVRGLAMLPNGTGKQVRVLVFAQGEGATLAEQSGADFVGAEDIIQRIEGGWVEFDTAIATPEMMSKIGKLGRILGRRGLMPNPRSGTVVQQPDLPKAISDSRKGKIEYRLDRTAVIHAPLGKASFEKDDLLENLTSFMDSVVRAKPSGAKGQYIKNISVSTTHGPGINMDVQSAMTLSEKE